MPGKHYFKIEKNELREFKNRPETIGLVGKNARSLILWTERGAARHAKMLETDQAWDVFEKLEDCYFSQTSKSAGHHEKKTSELSAKDANSLVWLWDYANHQVGFLFSSSLNFSFCSLNFSCISFCMAITWA